MTHTEMEKTETADFLQIFSNLNAVNKQHAMAILRSLQFAEEQERERLAQIIHQLQQKKEEEPL